MEPIVSTSFIPKRPVSAEPIAPVSSGRTVGILSFITFIIVAGTAASFGGVYFYQKTIDAQKADLQAQITQAQEGLSSTFVADMKRLSQRIEGVKKLIGSHVVVTPIFQALQATTLQSVQYQDFSYELTTDATSKVQTVTVSIKGVARNYSTLALQSDAFAKSTLIRNPVFSGLTVEEKTQRVGFKLTFTVNAEDLSYQTFIKNVPGAAVITTQ